ncbi:2-dehydro-3-deoxy-6-phosphogalactonate aldolase [Lelliottia wanjuensis]|uniref:2-dehydro-3-deoxy-6-phosphogalactonate aldolase n=1 Tax=Lelliottia wanjuensis TaxID=3050585 RepID=UPI002550C187|nr:2-dehydro-3-deoxy-6-phosphogalactonate aldolase [Lelliottia sp. V86_10]MDK9584356.1 2-dehydro-3-deoxy-6-phosphogalactonate aldolase [Lelliottia sp. V86_10]
MTLNFSIPLIAILRGITPEEAAVHIPLLVAAGFQAIEIPLNSPGWEISLARAANQYGDRVLIGGGTVLYPGQVEHLMELGCRLVVTPNICPEVIHRAQDCRMQVLPGCLTPTEAFTAIDAGAQDIKLFPAGLFGPAYIRALKAVLPRSSSLYAVGGITPENLGGYLAAGCRGVAPGNSLWQPGQTPEQTRTMAQAFITAYQTFATGTPLTRSRYEN